MLLQELNAYLKALKPYYYFVESLGRFGMIWVGSLVSRMVLLDCSVFGSDTSFCVAS